jgi:hypothetical protein
VLHICGEVTEEGGKSVLGPCQESEQGLSALLISQQGKVKSSIPMLSWKLAHFGESLRQNQVPLCP